MTVKRMKFFVILNHFAWLTHFNAPTTNSLKIKRTNFTLFIFMIFSFNNRTEPHQYFCTAQAGVRFV